MSQHKSLVFLLIWGVLIGPTRLEAQEKINRQSTPQSSFEEGDDYSTDLLKCVSPTGLTMVEKECIQDEKLNENDRQQTRAIDRWMRGGMLTVATIMNQVRRIGGVVQTTQSLVAEIRKGSNGFKDKKETISAYRVVGASDAADAVTNTLLVAGNALTENPGNRYFLVEASMQRSLQDASDGDNAAAQLSERILNLQYRLAKSTDSTGVKAAGIKGVRAVGGNWRDTLPEPGVCPPLPEGAPSHLVDGCLRPQGGESQYIEEETELSGSGPAMAMRQTMQKGGAAGGAVAKDDCPASSSDNLALDPKVVYERIIAAAKGAQVAAQVALVNTGMAEAEANIVRQAEIFFDKLKDLFMRKESLRRW